MHLRQIPIDNPGYEDIASKVTDNFFVDNYLDSFDDENSAISCCKRQTELLKKAGFKFHILNDFIQEGVDVLPFQDPLTDLIIWDAHETNFHSQISRTLYEVRTRSWILKGRRAVERIVKKCELCLKRYAKPLAPQMAPLPAARLQAFVPAFTNVGVDYFGPLYVSNGRRAEKRYGCLFTCLTTHAIHIELAHSMDTDSFLMAFRWFVSLRRSPLQVYSANGTNLTAGEKELREGLDHIKMDHRLWDQLADRDINWQFFLSGAPHFGGVWERVVRSAKSALRVVLGHQTVPEEVLAIILREVESMINERPWTHLSMNPKDPSPLTPVHFLLGYPKVFHFPPFFESLFFFLRRFSTASLMR